MKYYVENEVFNTREEAEKAAKNKNDFYWFTGSYERAYVETEEEREAKKTHAYYCGE